MRRVLICLVSAAALRAHAAFAGSFEPGVDRPGGAYAHLPASAPAACAALCVDDGLCLAWSYRANDVLSCALKAVVPPARADINAVSGVSQRASSYLSLVAARPPSPPAAPRPASPPMTLRPHLPPAAPSAPAPPSDDGELLGGP